MVFDRPTGPDDLGPWLESGGAALVAVLRTADADDAMWAWGPQQSVRFWSRRQLHETAIHRVDLAQAGSVPAQLEPVVAHDSILELVDFLPHAVVFLPEVEQLRGNGETIGLRATDLAGVGTITLTPDGFTFARAADAPTVEDADAALVGPVSELALVISRRRELDSARVELRGRRDLVEHWIAHSALL
jgi:Mycothiol maleylpyruvate isomerase N-terminal domain.